MIANQDFIQNLQVVKNSDLLIRFLQKHGKRKNN